MGSPEESRVARILLPQLKLDELLEELQARLDAARGTRDRVHGLLEAVLSVGRELDLEQVLHGIVEAAAVLVDAEYAALGVITPDGKALSAFHTIGVTEERIAEIGTYPEGHGILGELIRHPEPLRLAKISQHSSSYGFPAHHPPMNSFLGVPIRVRDQVFGNLYLTEKRGGAQFDEEDESVLSTLAVAAGVAIDNARLYEESRLRERWLQANAEITHSLMSSGARTDVLALIAERAGEITGSALAAVALPMEGTGSLAVLSEALTNIARHARAGRADVALETDGREVRLTVTDNGVGIPAEGRRSGLLNMEERARQLGGELHRTTPRDGGTRLVWRVPVTRK
ncbi:GAF domain-containing protein [Streptomyces sp. NBC_01261]|uniref:GAF domain-containing sensor histidine kinase n=1 Tax=Streptomyces sp. NBC_01261 TaxID=2903802 RepID=UPI002E31F20C|nr:GAF domain-containing protein [Streptomyces sp. NBC_01261]